MSDRAGGDPGTAGGDRPRRLKVIAETDPGGGAESGPVRLNRRCVLVSRLGHPVYGSCSVCSLELKHCIQFRGQAVTVALTVLLCLVLLAPVPQPVRYVAGGAMLAIIFWYLRYVSSESHKSILAAHELQQQRRHAEAAAGALGSTNSELDKNLRELHEMQQKLFHADKMAAIGTLAAGVAHEINNPLSYVIANLSFVDSALDDGAAPLSRDRGL